MISAELFETIKRKHGGYASWAVWVDAGEKPKSNMGDMSIFKNEGVLGLLNNNVVMVGLNFSRSFSGEPFGNFHDPRPMANDFKIRYAFKDSEYYGAYMTDIIKFLEEADAKNVMKHLSQHPEIIENSLNIFREEMRDLKGTTEIKVSPPLILAFGRYTYNILSQNLKKEEYSRIIKLTHYSHQISKEVYKQTVLKEVDFAMCSQRRGDLIVGSARAAR